MIGAGKSGLLLFILSLMMMMVVADFPFSPPLLMIRVAGTEVSCLPLLMMAQQCTRTFHLSLLVALAPCVRGVFHLFSCSPPDRGWKEASLCLCDIHLNPKHLLFSAISSTHCTSFLPVLLHVEVVPTLPVHPPSHLFFKMQGS